jgi:hypothetical protein
MFAKPIRRRYGGVAKEGTRRSARHRRFLRISSNRWRAADDLLGASPTTCASLDLFPCERGSACPAGTHGDIDAISDKVGMSEFFRTVPEEPP